MPTKLIDAKDLVIRKGGVFESWSPNDQQYMLITSEPELTFENGKTKLYDFDCQIYRARGGNTEYLKETTTNKHHFHGTIESLVNSSYLYYIDTEEAKGLILELDRLKKLCDLMKATYNKAYAKLTRENYRIHDSK